MPVLSESIIAAPERGASEDIEEMAISTTTTTTKTGESEQVLRLERKNSAHKQIPEPRYVRSQPIGLPTTASDSTMSPTISGGIARKLSLSSLNGKEDEEPRTPTKRPSKIRSESLPIYPDQPAFPESPSLSQSHKIISPLKELISTKVEDLPKNPKTWLPSQLAVYLAHSLRLPPLLAMDITDFVRMSRINGRIFLRLQDKDMEEMGINVLWRPVLGQAREQLRKETLSGRMWGYEGFRPTESAMIEQDEEEKEQWKRTWRTAEGSKSRGRVRGMAKAFEDPPQEERVARPASFVKKPRPSSLVSINGLPSGFLDHSRQDSTSSSVSAASVDSGLGTSEMVPEENEDLVDEATLIAIQPPMNKFDSISIAHMKTKPVPRPHIMRQRSSLDSLYNSTLSPAHHPILNRSVHILSQHDMDGKGHDDATWTPKRANSRPRHGDLTIDDLVAWSREVTPKEKETSVQEHTKNTSSLSRNSRSEEWRGSARSRASSGVRPGAQPLLELFGLETESQEYPDRNLEEKLDSSDTGEDLLAVKLNDRNGSLVLVRKSQLDALNKRLAEVESRLADAIADSNSSIGSRRSSSSGSISHFISSSVSAVSGCGSSNESPPGPLSWTALGGYCLAASIGIGIVAGEVVVSKLFGIRGHR